MKLSDLRKVQVKNCVIVAIAIVAIVYFHVNGPLALAFWFGGMFLIPGLASFVVYNLLSGKVTTRLILAIFPWLIYQAHLGQVEILYFFKTGTIDTNGLFLSVFSPSISILIFTLLVLAFHLLKIFYMRAREIVWPQNNYANWTYYSDAGLYPLDIL